jgi:hypothetical protein
VLAELMRRSVANLAASKPLQDYLHSAGLPDEHVWSEFRLGATGANLAADFTDSDLTVLDALGLLHGQHHKMLISRKPDRILLPTFDPSDPQHPVGLVSLNPSHHQHRFMSRPAGVACTADVATAERIILADVPILGLRLSHLGAVGVAVVEDPVVLPPLQEFLSAREIVIAGFRTERRAAIRSALGPIGERATEVTVLPEIERTSKSILAMLGVGPIAKSASPISLQLLRDLHRYAVLRLGRGDAVEALRQLGIDHAPFVHHYQIGYLPERFRDVLSSEQRQMVKKFVPGNTLVVPAFDEQRVVVDLLFIPVATCAEPIATVHDAPRGLIAAAVTTAFDEVIVVDTLRAAAELVAQGRPHTVLLRGVEDARSNASRIAANGVRKAEVRCQRNGDDIAAILHAAGIEITTAAEPEAAKPLGTALIFPQVAVRDEVVPGLAVQQDPEPAAIEAPADVLLVPTVSALVLIHHDVRTERATFKAGDITYGADVPWDERTKTGLSIKRGTQEHVDRLDLAVEVQRQRCASSAALRTGAPKGVIEAHLAQLHEEIRALVEKAAAPLPSRRAAPAIAMTEVERAEAMELARCSDLLDRVLADLTALSWVGETSAKTFTFLAAMSRNLDEPIWVALTANGTSERSPGLDAIAAVTPPEDCIRVSRLTDSAFYYADPAALRHKLLIIDDAGSITAKVGATLRVLKRSKKLHGTRVESDPVRGEVRTQFIEIPGPIAFLTATSGSLDEQLRSQVVDVAADDSPEHIALVLAERRRRLAHPASQDEQHRERAVARLRNLQRVISPRPVVLPFADRIDGFGASPQARRDHDTLLSLIASHALLHQHQRLSDSGSVVATVNDFTVAAALMNERMVMAEGGLGKSAQQLLATVCSVHRTSFTMGDLSKLLPGWTRHACRAALDELKELDYVSSPRGGRGAPRTYHLHPGSANLASPTAPTRITLREVGELAKVGETGFANFIPESETG